MPLIPCTQQPWRLPTLTYTRDDTGTTNVVVPSGYTTLTVVECRAPSGGGGGSIEITLT